MHSFEPKLRGVLSPGQQAGFSLFRCSLCCFSWILFLIIAVTFVIIIFQKHVKRFLKNFRSVISEFFCPMNALLIRFVEYVL